MAAASVNCADGSDLALTQASFVPRNPASAQRAVREGAGAGGRWATNGSDREGVSESIRASLLESFLNGLPV